MIVFVALILRNKTCIFFFQNGKLHFVKNALNGVFHWLKKWQMDIADLYIGRDSTWLRETHIRKIGALQKVSFHVSYLWHFLVKIKKSIGITKIYKYT